MIKKIKEADKIEVKKILHCMRRVQSPDIKTSMESFEIDTELGTDGLVHIEDNDYFLCFAGSNEITDWVINLSKGANSDGVHDGFDKAFSLARFYIHLKLFRIVEADEDKAAMRLMQLAKSNKQIRIYCGGYSNGAAIATLFAVYLSNCGFNVKLATWGQPKVFDSRMVNQTKNLGFYYRFAHPLDPVTWVPVRLEHAVGQKITTGGFHWFTHAFEQYAEQTAKLLYF